MKPETACNAIRMEISARLDGEVDGGTSRAIDDHLENCSQCREYEARLARVRSALRLQVVSDVPDLTDAILERVSVTGRASRRRDEWFGRFRVAAIAAAATVVFLIGSSLPFSDRPPQTATASEIVAEIRAAARDITAYRASFAITERGWHPAVPQRRMVARIAFEAPEALKLTVRDLTSYPDPTGWPRNDVEIVSSGRAYWIEEPQSCPVAALPGCDQAPTVEQRRIVARQPFDGSSTLPTDIIVPLETIASADGLEVLGVERLANRDAYRVALPYRQAVPLVAALQSGGSWRPFHPLDTVEIWIDSQTWFPLRFEIAAGDSTDRTLWSQRLGLADQPGRVIYRVRTTSFEELDSAGSFDVPRTGVTSQGGFGALDFATAARCCAPEFVVGLSPYRAGTTASGQRVIAYADGMTWLKVVRDAPGSIAITAEEVMLSDGGYGYYVPASSMLKRRIDVFVGGDRIHLESNLPREELLRVAASLPGTGRRAPVVLSRGPLEVRRVDTQDAFTASFARIPGYLPEGYNARAAVMTRANDGSRSVTVYYRRAEAEFDGLGIRVTQSEGERLLPPSSSEFEVIALGPIAARWSPERGELEWIDHGVYRAVAAPSFELGIALRVARGLL